MFDFNLGFPEIVTLAVLGVILFGPEKLPGLARKAGRIVAYLRGIANNARTQLHEELPELAELNLAELNPKTLAASVLLPPEPVATSKVQGPKRTVLKADPDNAVPFDSEAT